MIAGLWEHQVDEYNHDIFTQEAVMEKSHSCNPSDGVDAKFGDVDVEETVGCKAFVGEAKGLYAFLSQGPIRRNRENLNESRITRRRQMLEIVIEHKDVRIRECRITARRERVMKPFWQCFWLVFTKRTVSC